MTKIDNNFFLKKKVILLFTGLVTLINSPAVHATGAVEPAVVKGLVSGKVSGKPVAGASVRINGVQKTITDGRGWFLAEDGTDAKTLILEVAFIGYETYRAELPASGQSIAIQLLEKEDADAEDATRQASSIGAIDARAVEQEQGRNVLDALQGRVPGVTTDGDGSVRIRGRNSFNPAASDPLFIVDGVPLPAKAIVNRDETGQIASVGGINASNIERIEILKDADATSIYGSKGAGGVILITTRKTRENKLRVDAEVSAGISQISSRLDFLNTEEYLDIRRKAFAADGITPTVDNAYDLLLWGNQYHTDWNRELFGHTSNVYNALLNIAGGTGQTYYSINGGYYETGNIYLGDNKDKLQRINGGITLQHTGLGDRLKITAHVLFSKVSIHNKGGNNPETLITNAPNQPTYNDDASIYWVPGNSSFMNPLRNKYIDTENSLSTFLANFTLDYRILDELTARIDFGYNDNTSRQFTGTGSSYLNPYASNAYRNRVQNTFSSYGLFNIEPQINYTASLGKGKLNALLGATLQGQTIEETTNELRDFPNDALFKNAAAAGTIYDLTTESNQVRYASVFGRVNYDFKNRYIVNAVVRRDGSSRFYRDNRFGTFWSLGAAWLFYRESLAKEKLPFLSFGKLRGSYGLTGNDNVGDYKFLETYAVSTYPYAGSAGLYSDQIANTNFSWETTRKAELGLDLSFLKDRLQVNTSLYNHRSNNLIVAYPVGSQSGFSAYSANMNDALIRNQGIEVEILSTNINSKNLNWTTSFNITFNQNRLLAYPGIEYTSFKEVYAVGKSLSVTRLYKYTGVNPDNGAPTVEDVNRDGQITAAADKQFLESQDPDFYGGLYNSFRYRNFQLDVFFQFTKQPYKEGYLKDYYYPLGYLNKNPLRELASDYWTPENRNARYPGLTTGTSSDIGYAYYYYYTESDAVYSDASFIRFKNFSLSYDLPASILEKSKIKGLKFYLRGQNIYTFAKFRGWDPETGSAIPPFTTFVLGAKISF